MKLLKTYLEKTFYKVLLYLLFIQVLGLSIMSLFRLLLLFNEYDHLHNVNNKLKLLISSWNIGLHFDNVIASYVLIPPLIVLPILALLKIFNKTILIISNVYFIISYSIIFAISAFNIPYFHYFFRHINASILHWQEYGKETTGMLVEDKSYLLYLLLFIVVAIFFSFSIIWFTRKINRGDKRNLDRRDYVPAILILLLVYVACYFGTQGRIRESRIEISDSYIGPNAFLNQLSINPAFYLYKSSFIDVADSFNLIELDDAVPIVFQDLHFNIQENEYTNPKNELKRDTTGANVIIVLVESLTSDYLNIVVGGKSITPYMNKLKEKSLYFSNFYSQGTHTNQGLVASIYGFPSVFDRHMLRNIDINKFTTTLQVFGGDETQRNQAPAPIYLGLPQNLQLYGYETLFFMTHTRKFDNLGEFLKKNGFNLIYSEENYPKSKLNGTWGISDDFLFETVITKVDSVHIQNKKFLATVQTISNHPPYVIPESYKNISNKEDEQAVAFSDHCIEMFMMEASKKDWYNNTIFVFLGDHGKLIGKEKYDMSLSLNHIPLIIYSPLFNEPKQIDSPSGQIDIYPTLMSLLNKPSHFNSFGVDLLSQKRDYIYFTSDEKLGCISDNYFYTFNTSSKIESLYKLDDSSNDNIISKNTEVADSLKRYSSSYIEVAKYILKNNLTK